ncbi:cAMP-dependent protein kinase inhibitor gamma isoform X1 [Phasianus colchicus]|nr:cAMP-dependent protein kinase inhibitor gamma isoform X1 [Phasianus colchicus]XP_031446743.1 cAMP-dependent protein kinase inhibitor gamma isoform X1 [Phasianus colchicus]
MSCHLCHRELNRISSDTKVFCSLCKARLETEQNSEESLRILKEYRDAMEVESSTYTDFISCDRAGRRNAVHDIQRDANTISMRKLTKDIGELGVEGAESEEASTSSERDPAARPKEQESKSSP